LIPTSIAKKAYFYLTMIITLLLIFFGCSDAMATRSLILAQKERILIQIATTLAQRLPDSFDNMVGKENALTIDQQNKIEILHKRLQPIVDTLSEQYPGYGMGYGLRDVRLACVPVDKSKFDQVISNPSLQVYQTKIMAVYERSSSLMWGNVPTLSVSYPLFVSGQLIGHTWANTRMDDVNQAVHMAWLKNFLLLFFIWLGVMLLMRKMFNKIDHGLNQLAIQIKNQDDNTTQFKSFPELTPLLETVIELREGLKAEQERASGIVDGIHDGVALIDRDFRLIYMNHRIAEMGYTQISLGQSIVEVYPEIIDGSWFRTLCHVMQENRPHRMLEYKSIYFDLWLECNFVPCKDGVLVFVHEITQCVKVLADKNKAYNNMAVMLERITDGFFSLDSNFIFTYVNQVAQKWLKRSDLVGKHLWEEYACKEPFYSNYQLAVETQKPIQFEYFSAQKQSWLNFSVYPSAEGLTVYFTDVSERMKAQQAIANHNVLLQEQIQHSKKLLQVNHRLSQLVDTCPMPIIEVDQAGCIVVLNKAFLAGLNQYISCTREACIGQPISYFAELVGIPGEELVTLQVLSSGTAVSNKHFYLADREWLVTGLPIYDTETQVLTGAFAIAYDITYYENLKRELARLECLHVVGELASSMAHELRNVATPISGYIQLLSMKAEGKNYQYLTVVLEELTRLNEIIEDFLSLSRTRFIEKKACNLNDILKSLQPLLAADALKNDIGFQLTLSEQDCFIEGNQKEIKQLILNLARNAIEAMSAKGLLAIDTVVLETDVQLQIRDNGMGIPEEIIANIFEPFFTSKKNGTGLGLSVCRNIVEGHGGTISVQSELGQGTIFTIHFPRIPDQRE
jgi:signal transduction histidine kinase